MVFGEKWTPKFGQTPSLKALGFQKEEKTLAELAQQYGVHVNQISAWKQQLLEQMSEVFESRADKKRDFEAEVKELHAKIGELTMERDFLSNKLGC